MGLPKGQTNNPSGRPKGTPNKTTTEIKNLIQNFISANIETLQKDFEALEPKDRLVFFERTLRFIIPTQQSQELNINTMSDAEVSRLADELINKLD